MPSFTDEALEFSTVLLPACMVQIVSRLGGYYDFELFPLYLCIGDTAFLFLHCIYTTCSGNGLCIWVPELALLILSLYILSAVPIVHQGLPMSMNDHDA